MRSFCTPNNIFSMDFRGELVRARLVIPDFLKDFQGFIKEFIKEILKEIRYHELCADQFSTKVHGKNVLGGAK